MASPSSLLARYRDELCPAIEAALDRYSQLAPGCPAELREALRYSLLAPGKRLRPLLVLLAAKACGGQIPPALPPACAVEMIHAYSLVHDDLPAMDDDDLRRGRPTCHKQFGEALAILAGDALLALAFQVVAQDVEPPPVAARCCAELAEAAGPCQLVGGQADDILGRLCLGPEMPQGPLSPALAAKALAQLESIHRRKTGAMILVSLRLGGPGRWGNAGAIGRLGPLWTLPGAGLSDHRRLAGRPRLRGPGWQAARQRRRAGQTHLSRPVGNGRQ